MSGQASNTIFVMEGAKKLAHGSGMLTADQIREELIRQLDGGKLVGADVARALNIAPARVTEMRKGQRRVQQNEMESLAKLLGLDNSVAVQATYEIPNFGKVAQGVWLEETEAHTDEPKTVTYDRMKGDPSPDDLFAVTPEGTSMNLRFMPGTQLICRRIPFGSGTYQSGDYVIAQRKAHNLVEMTVKRLEIGADGLHWLHSESTDERFKEPWLVGKPDPDQHDDNEIAILAKVIRAVQDFERPA